MSVINPTTIRQRLKPILEKYPPQYHKELGKLIFEMRDEVKANKPAPVGNQQLENRIWEQGRQISDLTKEVDALKHERTELKRQLQIAQSAVLRASSLEKQLDDKEQLDHAKRYLNRLGLLALENCIKEADMIVGEHQHGRAVFYKTTEKKEPLNCMAITYDSETAELEAIITFVRHVKGRCDYEPSSD